MADATPDFANFLNRDAGAYAVAAHPGELEAGLRAAARTWEEFPYYELRFGERGRRFCGSDTGWLITLCDADPKFALEQVRWLGRVLSNRGMPQLLLETHLANLHEELVRSLPAERKRYDVLRRCARKLREQRESQLPPPEFARVAAMLPDDRIGELLASAVADERAGVEHAVASIEGWAAERYDGARVGATLRAARK